MSSITNSFPLSPFSHRRAAGRNRQGPNARSADRVAAAAARFSAHFRFDGTQDYFAEMWPPRLLERLQEPLTRYHE